MCVYVVVDDPLSPYFPLGVALEVFIRRGAAERFVERFAATIPNSRKLYGSRSARWRRAG